ncbi:calmodulin-binding receptor-like cytoplasmic kinase 3 isoform X2 [Aristolochia californica]|uniref:calmodulin-binding receptor-like cytoplasmic kinase 3 isoform X2 n=1 Tax=Aristolochia californica TaxID=171875 RepID=UPI0035DDE19B
MTVLVFVLLMLAQLTGPVVTAELVANPAEVRSLGSELFYGNGKRADDVLFCTRFQSYYRDGFFVDSELEIWERIGKSYCNLEYHAGSHQRTKRKLLLHLTNDKKSHQVSKEKKQEHLPVPMKAVMAISGIFLVCCTFLCPCFRTRRKETSHNPLPKDPSSVSSLGASSASERILASPLRVPPSPSRFGTSLQLTRIGPIHLNMSQVLKATHNFSPSLKIGEGGFGTVYRAKLQDGHVVAIKRAKKEHFDAKQTEFSSEVDLLAKIEHLNLVKLLGYVDKGNDRIIITEYVPNGTLREHLDVLHEKVLDFNQRLEIAIDVAHALTYLHLYAEKPIIHRDVKSSNILLTENLRAKVADFGFARLGPMEADQTHISTKVKGTAGYLDPEYLKTYQLTPKSDVYSFGILLIEILSARRPVELKKITEERVTVRWAFKKYNEGNLRDIMDPLMEEEIDTEIFSKILSIAFQCAAPTRADRPTMKEVGVQLWGIRHDYLGRAKRG